MSWFSDLWVIASEDSHIDGEIEVKDPRTDYLLSKALDYSWDQAFSAMNRMIRNSDPSTYILREYIQEHWDEIIEWSDTYSTPQSLTRILGSQSLPVPVGDY